MLQRAEGEPPQLVGTAAVYYNADDPGTEFQLGRDFVERVRPGAFESRDEDDVRGLFNHDPSLVLGRNQAGTLTLTDSKEGLRYAIDLADTQVARDVRQHVQRGDVTGSSFAFTVRKESYEETDDLLIRWLENLHLYDVSPVTYPAYQATEAALRSAETNQLVNELLDERRRKRAEYCNARLLQRLDDLARLNRAQLGCRVN